MISGENLIAPEPQFLKLQNRVHLLSFEAGGSCVEGLVSRSGCYYEAVALGIRA